MSKLQFHAEHLNVQKSSGILQLNILVGRVSPWLFTLLFVLKCFFLKPNRLLFLELRDFWKNWFQKP